MSSSYDNSSNRCFLPFCNENKQWKSQISKPFYFESFNVERMPKWLSVLTTQHNLFPRYCKLNAFAIDNPLSTRMII